MKLTTNYLMNFCKTTTRKAVSYRTTLTIAFAVALITACVFAGQTKASAAATYFDAMFGAEGFAASLFHPANAENNAVDGPDAVLATETWTGNSFFSNKSKTNGIAIKFYMLVF